MLSLNHVNVRLAVFGLCHLRASLQIYPEILVGRRQPQLGSMMSYLQFQNLIMTTKAVGRNESLFTVLRH